MSRVLNARLSRLAARGSSALRRQLRRKELLAPLPVPAEQDDHLRISKPVIIVGSGRSGTTLLFRLLGQHPGLVATRGFPDGEDTEMWVRVAGAAIAGFVGERAETAVGSCLCLPMDERDVDQQRCRFVHDHLASRYGGSGARRLLNKNPHLSNKLRFVHRMFPDVNFIHVIRNPLAVIASWKAVLSGFRNLLVECPVGPGACMNLYPARGWRPHLALLARTRQDLYVPDRPESVRLLARHWLQVNHYIREQAARTPSLGYQMVRHEDICAQPAKTLASVLGRCELASFSEWRLGIDRERESLWQKCLTPMERELIQDELAGGSEEWGYRSDESR
jgi:hypothetical protein